MYLFKVCNVRLAQGGDKMNHGNPTPLHNSFKQTRGPWSRRCPLYEGSIISFI